MKKLQKLFKTKEKTIVLDTTAQGVMLTAPSPRWDFIVF